ncbi:MAG: hypothetical protein ABIR36_07830 [Nitrospiraceae bacterium]
MVDHVFDARFVGDLSDPSVLQQLAEESAVDGESEKSRRIVQEWETAWHTTGQAAGSPAGLAGGRTAHRLYAGGGDSTLPAYALKVLHPQYRSAVVSICITLRHVEIHHIML